MTIYFASFTPLTAIRMRIMTHPPATFSREDSHPLGWCPRRESLRKDQLARLHPHGPSKFAERQCRNVR